MPARPIPGVYHARLSRNPACQSADLKAAAVTASPAGSRSSLAGAAPAGALLVLAPCPFLLACAGVTHGQPAGWRLLGAAAAALCLLAAALLLVRKATAAKGAALVALAHDAGIPVFPLIGPSSLLLALMGSGLSGQNFAFHGYLPAKEDLRRKKILELESDSRKSKRTQLFIETPYRNLQLLQTLIDNCAAQTRICVATDLTLDSESIMTCQASAWKRCERPDIDRRPTVFLLQA